MAVQQWWPKSRAAVVYRFGGLGGRAMEQDRTLKLFAKIVILGVLLSAFICGGMSDINDPYQAQVIWLVPLVAALVYLQQRARAISTI